ncbi:MAG: DUF3047 domain-containing protein [bacterium]|nr:DUF3047 domain-containing protein [bacterium]
MRVIAVLVVLLLTPEWASANPVMFDGSWQDQSFLFRSANEYIQEGNRLKILSDDSVSVLWRSAPPDVRHARQASWYWSVEQGVTPTDLSLKGGDDRNIALYFLFAPRELAEDLENASPDRVFQHEAVRILVYVRGGNHEPGTIVSSPYLEPRGVLIPLRKTGNGTFAELVDLDADFRRVFGMPPGVLLGLGISADSDDTDGLIEAELGDLVIE